VKAIGAPVFDPVKAATPLEAPVLSEPTDALVALDELGRPVDAREIDVAGVGLVDGEPDVTVTTTVTGEHDGQVGHAAPLALG
jgi:hypothetical protein